MPALAADLDTLVQQLGSGRAWLQIGIIALGFGLAWLLSSRVRERLPSDLAPGALKIGAGSVHRLVFPIVALVLVWLGTFVLARYQAVPLLRLALPLIASYALIRLVVYLLRHLIAPSALLKASERAIAYSVWAVVALYLTGVLPEVADALNDISFLVASKKVTMLQVVLALFWSVVTVFIALGVSRVIERRLMASDNLDMSMRVFAGKISRALAVVLAILITLPLLGIDITVLSVFGGALGVGLGLGMQKIASNYVSGFVILLDRSIRPGDLVTVDGRHGLVADIKARYTVIAGLDGTKAIIPNDTIITNTVLNHTYSDPRTAVKTGLTVGYDSNLDEAMALFLAAGKAQARVLAEPAPSVAVKALGDNGIELELSTWIRDAEQGQGSLRSDILLHALRAFQAAGVSIPYPQRELRMVAPPPSEPGGKANFI